MFKRFRCDQSGNFAILAGLMMLPMVLMVGFAIDGTRYYAARSNLQDAADMTSLALAASTEQDIAKLRTEGDKFILANIASNTVEDVKIQDFAADENQINLSLTGLVHTTFMRLANVDTMAVAASTLAKRAPVRDIEVALVLDNTYSMSETAGGVSRLEALRTASKKLVSTLLGPSQGEVKIGIVPYAQYVNVGMSNADASWIEKEADGPKQVITKNAVTTSSGKCEKKTQNSLVCPPNSSTSTKNTYWYCDDVDGVESNCRWKTDTVTTCNVAKVNQEKEVEICPSPAVYTTRNYKWYGCVGSRKTDLTRLHDNDLSVKYPGLMMEKPEQVDPNCLTPIVPLTTDQKVLEAAIEGLVYEKVSADEKTAHRPLTYIPTGMIWGQNILSPTAPFTEAAEYDTTLQNRAPRKILILMTDGDNTLEFRSGGTHAKPTGTAAQIATKLAATDKDTKAICDYSKSKKIELYSVAFQLDNDVAKKLLESCATDISHYFDASNSAQLISAFQAIADEINQVRLAK